APSRAPARRSVCPAGTARSSARTRATAHTGRSACRRVRAEYFQVRRLGTQFGERRGNARVLLMALDVDEEHVLPQRGAGARRARLDAAHADAVLRERREERVHRAGLVLGRHHQRSAVVAGRRRIEVAQDQEARSVVRRVLDGARQHVQAVALGGGFAGDRGGSLLGAGALRRLGVRGDWNALGAGQVLRQPAVALREGLGMRVDAPHGPQALSLEQEILLHAQLDLRANAKRRGEQQVERAADDAFGRVLYRHHGELHRARLAAAERVIDRARRLALDRAAEMLAYRLLAEGPLGSEVGDADRLLQAAAGRDHLAEYGRNALRGK